MYVHPQKKKPSYNYEARYMCVVPRIEIVEITTKWF